MIAVPFRRCALFFAVALRPCVLSFATPFRPRALSLALLLLSTASGCGSDDSPTGPEELTLEGPASLVARIDGDAFVSEFATAGRAADQVFINAGAGGSRAIGFTFPDQGTGTFSIGEGRAVSVGLSIGSGKWVAGQGLGSGTIEVTTFTETRIAGTFSFVVVTQGGGLGSPITRDVTDGSFDIEF